ncbi:MAG: hypothetical protein ACI8WB_004347 [Phenylobacterium sp.]|jgi:hypothetical protein
MLHSKKVLTSIALATVLGSVLSACGGSSNNNSMPDPVPPVVVPPATMEYQVTVTNLTNGQPLSPVALVLHETGEIWQIGQPASLMLETLAESGDNSGVMGADFVLASQSNGAVLPPGMATDITISTTDAMAMKLSLATMLVNTNDAFTGLNAIDLTTLEVGGMMSFKTGVYDAGTEANSEMANTIPGPADGGEGLNAARDDVDFVAMHPGVVSSDDGLMMSVLTGEHKFDNPAMMVKIMRLQ